MWGNPLFDLRSATGAMTEVLACRKAHPQIYIRVNAFDATRGFETTRLSFIVNGRTTSPAFCSSATKWAAAKFSTPSRATPRSFLKDGATNERGRRQSQRRRRGRRRRFERLVGGLARQRRAGRTRPRTDRTQTRQGAHSRHRSAAAGGTRAQAARLERRSAVAAHVLYRKSGHGKDHGGLAHGANPASTWATCAKGIWLPSRATTWWASTSATPHPKPRKY